MQNLQKEPIVDILRNKTYFPSGKKPINAVPITIEVIANIARFALKITEKNTKIHQN